MFGIVALSSCAAGAVARTGAAFGEKAGFAEGVAPRVLAAFVAAVALAFSGVAVLAEAAARETGFALAPTDFCGVGVAALVLVCFAAFLWEGAAVWDMTRGAAFGATSPFFGAVRRGGNARGAGALPAFFAGAVFCFAVFAAEEFAAALFSGGK